MHDGIADQRCLEDVLVRNARISRHVRRQSAQGFAHGCVIKAAPPGFIIEYETRLIRSSPKRIADSEVRRRRRGVA